MAVLAIPRGDGDGNTIIPTGSEPLQSGDLLVLAGTDEDLKRAIAVLTGPPATPDRAGEADT